MISIIVHSDKAETLAKQIIKSGFQAGCFRSPKNYKELWEKNASLIFIGALGICVREIAPFLQDKKTDPAVINIDANGQYVQAVVSGHVGGANALCQDIARTIGAIPIVTTVSDTSGLWALDCLPKMYDWKLECSGQLTQLMAAFVNAKKTALLLEVRDKGTFQLESSVPEHVSVFYDVKDIEKEKYEVILAVSPFIHDFGEKVIYYRPKVLHMGVGCQAGLDPVLFKETLKRRFDEFNLSMASLTSFGSADIKRNELAFLQFSEEKSLPFHCFEGKILDGYEVANPSDKVKDVTGSYSVSEAVAMHLSGNALLLEKQKVLAKDKYFTFAVCINKTNERKGKVEFVGAGPGDPELVSVRGKKLLQMADMILYAGSLVPKELTYYAKPGCVVKSSAGMDLQIQIATMKSYYDRGLLVVRLHTGDPCIYGAIQEQMAVMDEYGWNYTITPGISSFQAAAAALKSQFTIPEEVQTIILTRGEGRTPMPEREQIHKLAKSQSTMCLYLSATLVDKLQADLLEHYPADTPVAACYKLTWKDEKIFRCELKDLAHTVKENNLTMTTMIVVGKAIDNRSGVSKLYDRKFAHAFRDAK
ncbi:precorrin-4 C(11)-methyltransferase [Carboxylicivirga sp. N1Y90]|uniref:precorrin-4 C(11)-methyltransferase n=1 Tax=Carboxylicivirga fragile TaxID=3417571 RepID=UPI003D32D1CF|nr:precorrin-4 C(11)-methyltransferase [Marinilabiliaceae bacterium N1Y90]